MIVSGRNSCPLHSILNIMPIIDKIMNHSVVGISSSCGTYI